MRFWKKECWMPRINVAERKNSMIHGSRLIRNIKVELIEWLGMNAE